MYALISDTRFEQIMIFLGVVVAAIPASLAAYYGRGAKKSSDEAKSDAAEAKKNSAQALHEVSTNGGMSDPNPNLNDHVKYQTEMTEWLVRNQQQMQRDFQAHIRHSQMMDQALAEVYMEVRPRPKEWPNEDLPQPPSD